MKKISLFKIRQMILGSGLLLGLSLSAFGAPTSFCAGKLNFLYEQKYKTQIEMETRERVYGAQTMQEFVEAVIDLPIMGRESGDLSRIIGESEYYHRLARYSVAFSYEFTNALMRGNRVEIEQALRKATRIRIANELKEIYLDVGTRLTGLFGARARSALFSQRFLNVLNNEIELSYFDYQAIFSLADETLGGDFYLDEILKGRLAFWANSRPQVVLAAVEFFELETISRGFVGTVAKALKNAFESEKISLEELISFVRNHNVDNERLLLSLKAQGIDESVLRQIEETEVLESVRIKDDFYTDSWLMFRGNEAPIDYLDLERRQDYLVRFENGLLYYENPSRGNREVFDTTQITEGMIVMDEFGRIYIADDVPAGGSLDHASFVAGGRVAYAGMVRIEAGQIKYLDNISPAYSVLEREEIEKLFRQLLGVLEENGVDLSSVEIKLVTGQ
jgi:hypothetical protein